MVLICHGACFDAQYGRVQGMDISLRSGSQLLRAGTELMKSSKCCKLRSQGRRSSKATRTLWHHARFPAKFILFFFLFFLVVMLKYPDRPSLFPNNHIIPVFEVGSATEAKAESLLFKRRARSLTSNVLSDWKEEDLPHRVRTSEETDNEEHFFNRSLLLKHHRPLDTLGLSTSLKIYVYELPSRFNKDWLKNERCANHLFAAEVAIHQQLLLSPARTFQPAEAHFFFVPVYVSCKFSKRTGFPSLGHAPSLLQAAVKLLSHEMSYWNRSGGSDHVFVAAHDYGPCFRTMEELAVAAGIPRFLERSLILQTFGQIGTHACQAKEHIQIPPFVPQALLKEGWQPNKQHRDIWAFFRGKVEVHPKNVSGRVYSRGVRTTIWRKFHRNRKFFIKRKRSRDYLLEMQRSVFCLCPLGWAPWSPRLVESVLFGCVPVIIADKIALPYSHMIEWAKISVTVPEKDVGKLDKILDRVSRTNLSSIQGNLWKEEYRRALLYSQPFEKGDATWNILELLSRKLYTTLDGPRR